MAPSTYALPDEDIGRTHRCAAVTNAPPMPRFGHENIPRELRSHFLLIYLIAQATLFIITQLYGSLPFIFDLFESASPKSRYFTKESLLTPCIKAMNYWGLTLQQELVMANQSRSIHTLLARELSLDEINKVSGGDPICGEGYTDSSTEPTWGETEQWECRPPRWPGDTTCDPVQIPADDDGSWDFSCDSA